jgi:hypothetical protein
VARSICLCLRLSSILEMGIVLSRALVVLLAVDAAVALPATTQGCHLCLTQALKGMVCPGPR